MLTATDVKRHHDRIVNKSVSAGYDHLRDQFEKSGHDLVALTGAIQGVAVWDAQDRYVFAWQVNPHHLLFYLRRPALNVAPALAVLAARHHPSEVISVNNAVETKIKLFSRADAERLTSWLLPELPLPAGGRRGRRRKS